MKRLVFALSIAAAGVGFTAVQPAEAKIRCNGAYQLIPGVGPHASPYCEIRYLWQVASRRYGVRTSFAALRNSVDERQQVCQLVGNDSRVYSICQPYRNESGDKFQR